MDTVSNINVLMFPWLAHGHISPFLELGLKLSKKNFNIYLCSTSINLASIKKRLGDHDASSIHLIELPLETNLPPKFHTTNGLPPHFMKTLKKAYDNAQLKFFDILTTLKPHLLIYDLLRPWPAEAASALSIPAVQFVATSATMTSVMLHAFEKPGIQYPFKTICESVHDVAQFEDDENKLVMKSLLRSNKIVLVKGFKDMEETYCNYLSTLSGKKIMQVGTLVRDAKNDDDDDEDYDLIEWLNTKHKCSTVYVSFGSEYFLSDKDFEEIAHGLMLSKVNFIWVVRFPVGENIRVEDKLPIGFYETVGERGQIATGWAPQAKILTHESIGGFVSHCGWSSVNESMYYGIPIVAMPMHLDQPVNARLVEAIGVAIEIRRDRDGRHGREKIAAAMDGVVFEEAGEQVRKKAKELSDKIRNKGEDEIDEVVKELMQLVAMRNYKPNNMLINFVFWFLYLLICCRLFLSL